MSEKQSVRVLLLEKDMAVQAALTRVRLTEQVTLVPSDPDNPDDWINQKYAAVIADDSLFYSGRDEPLVDTIKRKLQCPIIYLALSPARGLQTMAREAGVAVVLPKPFGTAQFRKALGSVLHRDITTDVPQMPGAESPTAAHESNFPIDSPDMIPPAEHVAPKNVFDKLFQELERRQPLQDGLDAFDVVEMQLIRRALITCKGNQSHAARFLGITRNTLRKRIQKYGFGSLIARDE